MKPHKHAELIKAWADGAVIQCYDTNPREHRWVDCIPQPSWHESVKYRVKPQPKPDYVFYCRAAFTYFDTPPNIGGVGLLRGDLDNLKLVFDGTTGQLKSAEAI